MSTSGSPTVNRHANGVCTSSPASSPDVPRTAFTSLKSDDRHSLLLPSPASFGFPDPTLFLQSFAAAAAGSAAFWPSPFSTNNMSPFLPFMGSPTLPSLYTKQVQSPVDFGLKPTAENIKAYPGLFADFQMRAMMKAQELSKTRSSPLPMLPLGLTPTSNFHTPGGCSSNSSSGCSTDVSPASSSLSPGSLNKYTSNRSTPNPFGRYVCDKCKRTYTTATGLLKHQESSCSGDAKKFACTRCHKVYFSLSALKMHIRTHTLPCQCKVCGKSFSRMWLLNGHLRTHTGEKPFHCTVCSRAFADRSNLRAHMQTHSDVKKYQCSVCSKTFSRMGLLTKHRSSGCTSSSNSDDMSVLNSRE